MNVSILREAARLVGDADPREVVQLLELGSQGCILQVGVQTPRPARREWRIETSGRSVEVGR